MAKHKFNPDYRVAPGVTLAETMAMYGMSLGSLRVTTGIPEARLQGILDGSEPISFEDADAIALATGTPASFWNNLEANYRRPLPAAEA